MILANRGTSLPLVQAGSALTPSCRRPAIPKRRLCVATKSIRCCAQEGLSVVRSQYHGRCIIRPPPDGLPRIRDRDRVDYGAESDRDGHDAAGAAEHRFRLPHYRRQPAADGAVDLSRWLRCRPVRDGPAVGSFRPPSSSARRHGALLHRKPACSRSTFLRDAAAGAGAAGPRHPRPPASSRPRSFAIATPDGAWRAWCRLR